MQLSDKHVVNCKLRSNRVSLLDELPKNSHCAEVGVLFGQFSTEIVRVTQPQKFHLFDINNEFLKCSVEQIRKMDSNVDIEVHLGESKQTLSKIPSQSLDWIYLDADHSYEAVWAELQEARRIVKTDGYIILNDYIMYDHINRDNYGVVKAANQFCIEYNYELIFFALNNHMFCDIAIKKILD